MTARSQPTIIDLPWDEYDKPDLVTRQIEIRKSQNDRSSPDPILRCRPVHSPRPCGLHPSGAPMTRSSPDSEGLRQVLDAFYKTVDVMKSARNQKVSMPVWADDMKAVEDVMLFLENLRDATARSSAATADPVAWRYRFVTSVDGKEWSDWFIVYDLKSIPSREGQTIQPLYLDPAQAAPEPLREALEFYGDPTRYNGPNSRLEGEPDKYQPEGLYYRMDVTRDGGRIARRALALSSTEGK